MATTFLIPKNNAVSNLSSGITAGDLSLTLTAGGGAFFPSTFPFHISINNEILECTARAGDVLTIARSKEGTIAAIHVASAIVELLITAQALSDLNVAVNTIENTYAILAGRAGGQTINGGTAASENLNLISTSHATLGAITMGAQTASKGTRFLVSGDQVRHQWDGTGGQDYQAYDTVTNTYTIVIATVTGISASPSLIRISAVPVDIDKKVRVVWADQAYSATLYPAFEHKPAISNINAASPTLIGIDFQPTWTYTVALDMGFSLMSTMQFIPTLGSGAPLGAGSDVASLVGALFSPTFDGTVGPRTINQVIALYAQPRAKGGTTTTLTGVVAQPRPAFTGTIITIARCFDASDSIGTGAPTLGTIIGLEVRAFDAGWGTRIGIRNAEPTVYTPSTVQTLVAATAILANATTVMIQCTGVVVSTATPLIADGQDGQELTILMTSGTTFTITDQGTLPLSGVRLSAATFVMGPRDSLKLVYSSTVGDWVEVGRTNVL